MQQNIHNYNTVHYNSVVLYFLERYLVQLIKSTNETIKPATYLLQVQSDKITGYRTAHNGLEDVAWSWDISTFYAYRVHKQVRTEIEIIIGKLVQYDCVYRYKTGSALLLQESD